MRAIVREAGAVSLREVPDPELQACDEVLIRVAVAGICRTDLYAAQGRIGGDGPLILGHEFAGTVEAVGASVRHVAPGSCVTVMPWVRCGACRGCEAGRREVALPCLRPQMLGVDLPGAFAEKVRVPAAAVYPLPGDLSLRAGAYVEPIAASLAVLKADLFPAERGLIYGENRIARLTHQVLLAHGFDQVDLFDPEAAGCRPEEASYDFVIETVATAPALEEVLRSVRPGGKVVLKSRPCRPVELDVRAAVLKEITFHAVNYSPFTAAIDLAADTRFDLTDLLGPEFPLAHFAEAFQAAEGSESRKVFLTVFEPEESTK